VAAEETNSMSSPRRPTNQSTALLAA